MDGTIMDIMDSTIKKLNVSISFASHRPIKNGMTFFGKYIINAIHWVQ